MLDEKFTAKHGRQLLKKQLLKGKINFLDFGFFLEARQFFCITFCNISALKDKVPNPEHAFATDLFELPLVFIMTMILLTSSLTSVYAMYHMKNL